MVKLPQIGTIKKEVPKTLIGQEGGWIEFWEEPPTKLALEVQGMDTQSAGAIMKMLTALIKDWNFTDDKDKKYPITREVFEGMGMGLFNWIAGEVTKLVNKTIPEKKS